MVGFIVAAVIVINIIFAALFSDVAHSKGYEGSSYFIMTLFFGIFGCLWVIALPDLKLREIIKNANNPGNNKSSESDNLPEL